MFFLFSRWFPNPSDSKSNFTIFTDAKEDSAARCKGVRPSWLVVRTEDHPGGTEVVSGEFAHGFR